MATSSRLYLFTGLVSAAISAAVAFVMIKVIRDLPAAAPAQTADASTPPQRVAPQTADVPTLPKTVVEEGEIEVTVASDAKGTAQQFYRIPFASPPQLTFPAESSPGDWNTQILEQTAEGFKASRDVSKTSAYSTTIKFKWRAEGLPKQFP